MEHAATSPSTPQPAAVPAHRASMRQGQDAREQVRLHGERETWHWCRYFHCTEDRLLEAMNRVGSDVEALERELL